MNRYMCYEGVKPFAILYGKLYPVDIVVKGD